MRKSINNFVNKTYNKNNNNNSNIIKNKNILIKIKIQWLCFKHQSE